MWRSHHRAASTIASGRPSSPTSRRGTSPSPVPAPSAQAGRVRQHRSRSPPRRCRPRRPAGPPYPRHRSRPAARRRPGPGPRSPGAAARLPPSPPRHPSAPASPGPAAPPTGQLPGARATSGETAPARPAAGPRPVPPRRTSRVPSANTSTRAAASRPLPRSAGDGTATASARSPPAPDRSRPARRNSQPAAAHAGRSHREHLRVLLRDPVIRADIDHHASPAGQAGEKVRRMPPITATLTLPVQPERLRRHRGDVRVEVQQHQVITFQPGLEPHVTAGAWPSTTSPRSSPGPSRNGTAGPEPHPRTARQRTSAAAHAASRPPAGRTPARTSRPPAPQQRPED